MSVFYDGPDTVSTGDSKGQRRIGKNQKPLGLGLPGRRMINKYNCKR